MSYEYLAHHGILGQKWGVRRFQNRDGSYTPRGRDRHADAENGENHAKSAKASFYRTASKVYALNERTYKKSNKTLSSMNEAAKKDMLKKASQAQKEADAKKQAKMNYKNSKLEEKQSSKNAKVDAYRQKLADKSAKKAEKEAELSKKDMRDAKDLRKNGTKSEAYKEWAKAQLTETSENEGFLSKATELAITSKYDVADLMGQKIRSSDEHKAASKAWMAKNEHFMNLNIKDQKVTKLNLAVDYYLGHYKK